MSRFLWLFSQIFPLKCYLQCDEVCICRHNVSSTEKNEIISDSGQFISRERTISETNLHEFKFYTFN